MAEDKLVSEQLADEMLTEPEHALLDHGGLPGVGDLTVVTHSTLDHTGIPGVGQTQTVAGTNGITNTGNNINAILAPTYGTSAGQIVQGNDTRFSKVKASGTDTTPNTLTPKLVAGTNVVLAILNPGGDEQVEISSAGGGFPMFAQQVIGTRTATLTGVETFTTSPDTSYVVGNDELTVYRNGKLLKQADVTELTGTTFSCSVESGDTIVFITGSNAFAGQIQDEGSPLAGSPHVIMNFTGAGVTASDGGGGVATINIPGSSGLSVREEGVLVTGGPHGTLNFVGGAITATDGGGGTADITVVATNGLTFEDENVAVTATPHTIANFVGDAVAVTNAGGGQANITITAETILGTPVTIDGTTAGTTNIFTVPATRKAHVTHLSVRVTAVTGAPGNDMVASVGTNVGNDNLYPNQTLTAVSAVDDGFAFVTIGKFIWEAAAQIYKFEVVTPVSVATVFDIEVTPYGYMV